MRIVKLDIVEDAILQGVDEIAFVESPAIEEDYYAFSKQAFATYTDYPQAASDNAARAVKYATENGWGGCGTAVGKARAHQLAKRQPVSEETIARMAAFERHRRNSNTPYGKGCGGLMWDAWGGSEGVEWAQRKLQNIREERMALEVGGLPDYANELIGTNMPVTESFQTEEQLAQNIDVFGYKTKYIFICPGAIGTFTHLKTMNPDEDTIGMIRSAAVVADSVFKIEYDVLEAKEATPEQLAEATILVEDFKDIMHEIDEAVGMTHDVSYMDGHVETIRSYTPEFIEEAFAKLIYQDLKALGAEGISEVETKELFSMLEDQQMIISPLMIPNKLIERIDEKTGEEYYVYFTPETIKKIAYKFMQEKLLDKFNLEHDSNSPVKGAMIVESWLVEDPLTDKARIYGFSVPPGSWIAMVKVTDKAFWQTYVKSGYKKGFSVEGYFSDKVMSYAKEEFVNPRAGESQEEFISRCIPVLKNEGYADDQAAAICYSTYREGFAEVGPRGGIVGSEKAPDSDTPNRSPRGQGTARGSAGTTRGAEVTQEVEDILKKKSDDFNERYKDKLGYGTNIGTLKSVYQRGVGAYNTSHSPNVSSSQQWALGRVNAFLYLVKNGRPENRAYTNDYDLLPSGHPKA